MSIKTRRVRKVVGVNEFHCDGPKHEGDTFMQCDAITVEHGYGSPHDGDTHHFCGVACLKDWAATQRVPRKKKASSKR